MPGYKNISTLWPPPVRKATNENCELEGPYECPYCAFHMMLDATYLDQVSETIVCPGCRKEILVPEALLKEKGGD